MYKCMCVYTMLMLYVCTLLHSQNFSLDPLICLDLPVNDTLINCNTSTLSEYA